MIRVKWIKCGKNGDHWCELMNLDLPSIPKKTEGVYIIWHAGDPSECVYVGQGNIRERLGSHRRDKRITAYKNKGLLVTWASVSAGQQDGIEAYLADKYDPLVGDAHPVDAAPIAVNLVGK